MLNIQTPEDDRGFSSCLVQRFGALGTERLHHPERVVLPDQPICLNEFQELPYLSSLALLGLSWVHHLEPAWQTPVVVLRIEGGVAVVELFSERLFERRECL